MKNSIKWKTAKGFALPTVMIASVVMLLVLLSGLVSASSVNSALKQQYFDRLLKEARQSGVAMARACLAKTGTPQWSNASPLRPNSGCSGSSAECTVSACYLLDTANIKTTFTVVAPTLNSDGSYTINSTGSIVQYRTSSATVLATTTDTYQAKVNVGWKQISAGTSHACGISMTDITYCWGTNNYGQLGTGNTTNTRVPTPIDTSGVLAGKTIKQISTSLRTTCAIASDDKAYCWGYNDLYGELGNNTAVASSSTPVAVYTGGVLSGKTMTKIAGGGHHFCALDSTGKAYCWGENVVGDLGNNTTNSTPNPQPVAVYTAGVLAAKTLTKITIGRDHSCALASDFTAYCWGYGFYGQLANNSSTSSSIPLAVTGGALAGKSVVDINAGRYHTCSVTSDGLAQCWGDNTDGAIGNNSTTIVRIPTAVYTGGVLGGKTVTQIDAGYYATCATASSRAYCWGRNTNGQRGNTGTASTLIPIDVDTTGVLNGVNIASVTLADDQPSSFALATNNRFYGFGSNAGYIFGFWESSAVDYTTPVIGGTAINTFLY